MTTDKLINTVIQILLDYEKRGYQVKEIIEDLKKMK